MSDPEVLLPANKLFFFPFMAAGLTCSMMLHIPILTFIFHQSFLPYYIKKQLRAKMWPLTPLSDFFLTTTLCRLDWHEILYRVFQLGWYLVQTLVTSAAFCNIGAVKYFVYPKGQSGRCGWMTGFRCVGLYLLLLCDTTRTPTILQRMSRPSLSDLECLTPCFVVLESCLALKDVRLRFVALFWRVCFQRLRT